MNEPQREAVLHEEGPLLVVAGAGSGKTRLITRRIAHLIRLGHPPYSILGVTFTNKAAGEMRDRVDRLAASRGAWISTFHALGARILRMDGEHIGIPAHFTIYDDQDQQALIKEVLKALNLDTAHYRPASLSAGISRLKNDGISPEEAASSAHYFTRMVGAVYGSYQERLRQNRALDFDDLLLETLRLLQERDDVLARYRDRFRFILIDEYQDTNQVQYELARILAGEAMNLCATGDPDQSIYSWRGACVRNILEFEKDFPGTKIIKLEQNYRSTGNILKAASAVIAHNRLRKDRSLWTEASDGRPIALYAALGDSDEAEWVVRTLVERNREGCPFAEMAVLYRTNALSRPLERSLSLNNIPYAIVGGVAFYERREIKDLMAYLKLIHNPEDTVSLLRVINTPPRSIGQRTVDLVRQVAAEMGCSILEAVRRICAEPRLSARQVKSLQRFLDLHDGVAAEPRTSVEWLINQVIDRTRYLDYLKGQEGAEASERVDNVHELVSAAAEYDRNNPEGALNGFLEETALIQNIDAWEGGDDRVVLMTLHMAKGLEFKAVFLVGVEEGLLPHAFSMDQDESLEEERRLFYVGMTRAREKLHLSYSASRIRSGGIAASPPSRFLRELPPEVLERTSHYRRAQETGPVYEGDEGSVLEYDEGIVPEFRSGDPVIHPYFGRGEVLQVSGNGLSARVKVRFQGQGDKLLLVRYAKLKKVL